MFYVYEIEWSTIDSDYVIFFHSRQKPAEYLKAHYPDAKYYHFICSADKIENFHN